jgi:thioredoxin-like negative regulator of GroEL
MKQAWILTLLAGAMLAAAPVQARGPEPVTNINQAIEQAGRENKLIFLQYGRVACGNCQSLKRMISEGAVRLSKVKWVYADVNCDDEETRRIFREKFKVEGTTLPFVVVAGTNGVQLASRSGYGTAAEYTAFMKAAAKKAKVADTD